MKLSILSFCYLIAFSFLFITKNAAAQHKAGDKNLVYVDKQGVLRWTNNHKEAAFFGVNYTVPFAYGYRSHQALNVDIEKAIDNDVYHLARLGLDAFRVHVWDTEISDSLGNLLENEHLRLFDYLLAQLEKRNIKILITPIAFWGNGYPERDEKTPGFSRVYGKNKAVVDENAIQAQENYLKQFFQHINPYTHQTYTNDKNVIAAEINNEPHHSGQKEKVTEYINRLAAAIRSTGWTKPVFYNISESPTYADAVANANVQGHSFQWYPTGLVANHTLQGNYLPNVDTYRIPFMDTIPQFRNKARMVYEFDAADVIQSNMYPAIVRSFREAGFQWATQFAYDPMATAYANTEYQTHYLNLAYTPSKAISLLIAAKVFHQLPRLKNYGTYPADTTFDVFRVSYKNQLSEMNTDTAFYYSNTTTTKPIVAAALRHIAGVGSSPAVQYGGYGAYFLDKISDGLWRLEVMPDAVLIRDPFEKASPQKEVTRIQWQSQPIQIHLPDLGADFTITALNEGNRYADSTHNYSFLIPPGTYLIRNKKAKTGFDKDYKIGVLGLHEFVAPRSFSDDPFVLHTPFREVSAEKPFFITAKIVGVDTSDKVAVEMHNTSNQWKTISMKPVTAYDYVAEVPATIATPGLLNYRIIIQKKENEYYTFPGNHKGNPYSWDYVYNDIWQTFVTTPSSPLVLFNPDKDQSHINIYNPDWRNNTIAYVTAERPEQLVVKATMNQPTANEVMGWETYIADQLRGRKSEIASFTKLIIRARTNNADGTKIRVATVNSNAIAYSTFITVTSDFKDITIPLSSFKEDSLLLLPRPYPGFQPLWFKANASQELDITDAEKLQISFSSNSSVSTADKTLSVEIESVWLEK